MWLSSGEQFEHVFVDLVVTSGEGILKAEGSRGSGRCLRTHSGSGSR